MTTVDERYERIEWTPPIFGYQYEMRWERRELKERLAGKPQTTIISLWIGTSVNKGPLQIYCQMKPKFSVMWTIQISVAGATLSLSHSSYDLLDAIKQVEARVEACLEGLKGLME
jgi:hypothetical protein